MVNKNNVNIAAEEKIDFNVFKDVDYELYSRRLDSFM